MGSVSRILLIGVGLSAAVMVTGAAAQTRRDSAGVQILIYSQGTSPPARWTIDPNPLVEFGGATGTGPTEFTGIVDLLRTEAGTLIVADKGSQQIRFFDPQGQFLRKVGGPGGGPTEFRQLWGLDRRADTLYGLDASRGMRLFTLTGNPLRAIVPIARLRDYRVIDPVGVFAGGSFLFRGSPLEPPTRTLGIHIDSTALLWLDPTGTQATILGRFPGSEVYDYPKLANGTIAFGASLNVVAFQDRFCVGWPRSNEIRCFSPDGELRQIIRQSLPLRPVTSQDRAAYIKELRAAVASAAPTGLAFDLEGWLKELKFAPTLPAFAQLLAAETGELWVRDYYLTDGFVHSDFYSGVDRSPRTPVQWTIFGPDGGLRATVLLPAHVLLFHVGPGHVVGVRRDEDDLESVVVYRLLR